MNTWARDRGDAVNFWATLPQPVIGLSPMDGVTDAPFRVTVARQGRPDVIFTEFTSVMDICRGAEHLLASLVYSEEERPVVAQIYGKDPDLFYHATFVVCDLGFDGVDINMGCPSRNVASSGSGAALIRTPDRARAILQATRQAIADWAQGRSLTDAGIKPSRQELVRAMNLRRTGCPTAPRRAVPLSVKTRLGYDTVVIDSWMAHLLEEAPVAISIHGRTLEQMYRGAADWAAITRAVRLAQGTGTLVLGNGDVHSLDEVVRRVEETGVHGVLVGRAVLGEPWFFQRKALARRQVGRLQAATEPADLLHDPISLLDRFRVMLDHARQFEAVFGIPRFPRMRKHLAWYCTGFPHAAALRVQMVRASNTGEVERLVEDYLAGQALADPAAWEPAPATVAIAPSQQASAP
ncbi:MAG: tRNA dihydrouridine synthase [Nitrospirales bacterium]